MEFETGFSGRVLGLAPKMNEPDRINLKEAYEMSVIEKTGALAARGDAAGKRAHNRLLILLAGLNLGMVIGVVYSWSIFVLPLEELHGWVRTQTSLTYTFMVAFQCVGLLTGGVLVARAGVRMPVVLGAFMLSVGFLGASMADTLPALYISYGMVAGVGLGIINVIPTAVCMSWYPEKRGLVSGLCHMSIPLGTLIYGSTMATLFIGSVGISMTFRILGIIFLAVSCICAIVLRMPPADFNLPGKAQDKPIVTVRSFTTRETLRSPSYKFIWLWVLTLQIGGFMATGHIAPFAVEMGLPEQYSGLAVGIFALGNGTGKLGLGFTSDKTGAKPAMFTGMSFMFLGLLGMALFSSLVGGWMVLPFSMLAAMGFGGLFSLLSVVLMSFYGTKNYGMHFAISSTPMIIAAFVGPYLGSFIRVWTGDYRYSFMAAAVLSALGFIWIANIKPPRGN